MTSPDTVAIETDVLIVGGGLAGLSAAIAAAERGARVAILEKAGIERSGAIGGGVDHFIAYLEAGEPWDTRDAYLRWIGTMARGAVDLRVHNAIYCRELKAAIERLARIGNPLTQPDGTYYRTAALGMPGPYAVNFNGKHLKPRLAKVVRGLGCQVMDRVATTNLLCNGGRVAGAMGFQIRTGEFVVAQAKATVVTTGRVDRLFENPTGIHFNTWQCPSDVGAAQAMAFRAGAALANMEYLRITVVPKGFAAAGLNALTGMGGRFINAMGEQFMARYDPSGDKAPRYRLAQAVMEENHAGRGPVFIDCRQLTAKQMEHLYATLSYDKDTLPDFLAQKGIDLAKDPVEVMAAEGHLGGPAEGVGSGLVIDETCGSTLEGLFAAGDCTNAASTASPAVTSGCAAGKAAAAYALKAQQGQPSREQVEAEREWVVAPLRRKEGILPREMEETAARIMWQQVGPARTEAGMRAGLDKLLRLEAHLDQLRARDLHELMRANEVRDLLLIGKIMATAALYRRESRFGIYHRRLDCPEMEDAWNGQVRVKNEGGRIAVSFCPLSAEVPEP